MAAPAPAPRSASLRTEFISVGCNRLVHVLDWSSSNLVAYAAGAMVAIFNPQRASVVRTLLAHKKRVNTVRWLPSDPSGPIQLVSGGADNHIAQWTVSSDGQVCTRNSYFEAHADSVSALASIRLPSGDLLLASASADCTICIWKRTGNAEWTKIQTMSLKPRQPESLAFGFAPGSPDTPLLAVGGTDPTLRLWAWDAKAQQFGAKCYELHGHEDWIRALAFCTCPNSDVLLASAGQDNYIRLWRLTTGATAQGKGLVLQLSSGASVSVHLDAVLSGHEDWVYSVAWRPAQRAADGKAVQAMELLSASMDRTTVLWAPLEETETKSGEGMWSSRARMGEMGGTTLGFYGAVWSPTGSHILAHGYNGAMHLWHRKDELGVMWEPQLGPSGHYLGVEDVVWDPSRTYFVSTSEDQTTRAFARWTHGAGATSTWHEIARPIIHGFDMTCAAFVNNVPHRLVAGAEEKVLRVFDAPASFINTLANVCGVTTGKDPVARALGAAQPPLGLSNKPILSLDAPAPSSAPAPDVPKASFDDEEGGENIDDRPPPIVAQGYTAPPFEEQLLQATLWPEIQKLYGHGDALHCVAASNGGALIASACHGNRQHESVVRLTETTSGLWKEVAALALHKTTVTQLHFSPSDRYLLSVSRDRGVGVWLVGHGADARLLWKQEEAHERIVWTGAWAPDDAHFATGSRDMHVKVWAKSEAADAWHAAHDIKLTAPVTLVSWLPLAPEQLSAHGLSHALLVGLETGALLIMQRTQAGVWQAPQEAMPAELAHQATVRRAAWRVVGTQVEVVTCSQDHSVRLWSVQWL